ncbi:PREDICTED: gamma-aminobutyric acid receptor subunit alpha-6 [Papilio polytes]|uniref:gamma-aminobutyric acid receptor subunit alpha-6 n=1 Tax=Papilio polytes TaxID=76194 RepID=UPI0006762A45|nr:PREDICTED: gamma-aminobutyric acid receptor subunit alpha-6 [Papilio polytes]
MSEPNNAVIKYLPQFGQGLMAVGYVMDHFGCYEAPLPKKLRVQCSDKMKILYPKCNPQKTSQISNRIKFHMPVKNINLSLAKNLLIILAYTLANIFSGEYPLMTGFMVILGHLLAIASDSCCLKADAKGAIYLTTKNGTFPISLTSLNSQDDVTQDAARIFSATTKNVTSLQWDDIADDILFSNSNETQDYDNMWKNNQKRSINDAVSKNITLVLENLLKNYENSQLPTHGKGYPTVVQTNILIRSMGPVSELDMDYSMDCYFRQYWRDTRLSFLGPIRSLSLSIKMLERIWRPDTYFYNGKHSYVHTITVPNKLLRISQHGDILYSMRLTIKAKCPMELRNFPMDRQSCPLILGSYAYSNQQLVYQWQNSQSVNFVPGMTLSQFDLISFPYRNFTFTRREGDFSVLQVSFNLQRHTGYFLIQVYVPCILIVVLSWVSFWIHREATSDRVGLGITTVLTLSTISLDSRTDLPKVRYATALDWFLLMSFFYCIATLLEFAGVHYFTKVGSGEIVIDDAEWEELIEEVGGDAFAARQLAARRRSSSRSATNCNFSLPSQGACGSEGEDLPAPEQTSVRLTMERTTQTERRVPRWRQLLYCLAGDDRYRRQRQIEAGKRGHINSVSHIDRAARVLFPASFALLNLFYWMIYALSSDDFAWSDNPINTLSH